MKKKYLIWAILPVAVFAITGVTYANSNTGGTNNPMVNLVTVIAQRFNLNVSDVQQVFDEQKIQMEAKRKQEFIDRINQAVTDGKLTQEQAGKRLQSIQNQPERGDMGRMGKMGKGFLGGFGRMGF